MCLDIDESTRNHKGHNDIHQYHPSASLLGIVHTAHYDHLELKDKKKLDGELIDKFASVLKYNEPTDNFYIDLFFIPDVKYYIAVLFVFLDFFVSCFTSI
jgi:hypothetical protein